MRVAGALIYASFVAAVFASVAERMSLIWVVLAWAVVVLLMGALFRVHAVVNSPNKEDS